MIQIRCPHKACSIEVEDDMLGARIRCPHCAGLLFVKSQDQIKATNTTAPEPASLENQIYDGLPPLSVMMALRQSKQDVPDELDIRHQMTEDDWKALTAFEHVLLAGVAVKISLVCGIAAIAFNLFSWIGVAIQFRENNAFPATQMTSQLASLAIVTAGLYLLFLGRQQLERLEIGAVVSLLPWAMLCVTLVLGVSVVLTVMLLFGDPYRAAIGGCPALVSLPVNLIACIDGVRTFLSVRNALTQVQPPEVLHRLTEALKQLEENPGKSG